MAARGTAEWKGDLKGGSGTFTAGDGISGDFSFKTRFEDAPGANPEQLIGAALASCFSMALSNALAMDGHVPESVRTEAVVSIGKIDGANSIARIDLTTIGDVPGHRPGHLRGVRRERADRLHREPRPRGRAGEEPDRDARELGAQLPLEPQQPDQRLRVADLVDERTPGRRGATG